MIIGNVIKIIAGLIVICVAIKSLITLKSINKRGN